MVFRKVDGRKVLRKHKICLEVDYEFWKHFSENFSKKCFNIIKEYFDKHKAIIEIYDYVNPDFDDLPDDMTYITYRFVFINLSKGHPFTMSYNKSSPFATILSQMLTDYEEGVDEEKKIKQEEEKKKQEEEAKEREQQIEKRREAEKDDEKMKKAIEKTMRDVWKQLKQKQPEIFGEWMISFNIRKAPTFV